MQEPKDPVAGTSQETPSFRLTGVARYCLAHGAQLVKGFVVLSSGLGILFYVTHSVRIHYVPSTDFADLAGVFVLLFLVGSALLGYFALLVGAPAALWASTLPTGRPVSGRRKGTRARKSGCADYFPVVALGGGSLVFAWLLFAGYDPEAVVVPVIFGMGFVVGVVSRWCDRRSGAPAEGWLERASLRAFAVVVLLMAMVFAVQIATASGTLSLDGQPPLLDALVGGSLVVAANVLLVSIIRTVGWSILPLSLLFAGIGVMVMVFFGGKIVDLSVRALGLGLVPHVSLALDAATAERARQAGFACAGPVGAATEKGKEGCILTGFLVTRIGSDYVLRRTEDKPKNGNADSGSSESTALTLANYLVIPKAHAMPVPANVSTRKDGARK